MIGAFVAAAVVGLVQLVRSRDRKLLPLTAMLAFQAAALFDRGGLWGSAFQLAVCGAGLVLMFLLSATPAPPPPPPPPPKP